MKPHHKMIPYNCPTSYINHIDDTDGITLGLGINRNKCEKLMQEICGIKKILLTPSCSASLEMAALAINIQPGDEVILPSFTFVTSASAFALRGARLVFVDIRSDTFNLDERLIEDAITPRTKAVVVVHYAGVSAEMDVIVDICNRHDLILIEDAAQALMSTYKGRYLGSMGHFGCISYHHTKNIHAGGEGGALLVNERKFYDVSEIIQEKGTDRSKFLRGEIDKYTWQRLSSSYVMSEIQAIVLLEQLQNAFQITSERRNKWGLYQDGLSELASSGFIKVPIIPAHIEHNAHIYHIRLSSEQEQRDLFDFMRGLNVEVTSHFVPLHSSPAGCLYGRFHGEDINTTSVSKTLLRLPLYSRLTEVEQNYIIDAINSFFE
ncbi:dTDP-4-amino-4,6-dideoxygalactose transaminase [Aeromonas hydrophila]|uniref:dTDP-4-amino-4,6-dideoxygalactose transaminase n=1 Tax=Aeromonas hydrophila TaxID=644 RepID=UPI002B4A2675|nr:dTDP-4-amino-4,6-dideoxygalactose transaminase [Aeromonas hydrophila]